MASGADRVHTALINPTDDTRVVLAVLSGVLFGLSFIDSALYLLGWFAWVPILLAIRGANYLQTYWLGLIFGVVAYAIIANWIVNFIILFKGYSPIPAFGFSLLFWLYCAHLPITVLLLFRLLQRHIRISDLMLFPLVLLVLYATFPMLIPIQVGETQSRFTLALQAIDITGVFGLDGIIGLCNILIVQALCQPRTLASTASFSALAVLGLWFAYGSYALSLWDKKVGQWSTLNIGLIQPNEFPQLEELKLPPGFSRSYPPEMEMTERLSKLTPDLVIWPEARYKGYIDHDHVRRAFSSSIEKIATPLLFQDMGTQKLQPDGTSIKSMRNRMIMLDHDGAEVGQYQKMKRIPFGEYLPLPDDIPLLSSWIRNYLGDFLSEIKPGKEQVRFAADDLKVIPLICYETVFPRFVARAIDKQKGGLLVAASSNAWFGRSTLAHQHGAFSTLRAVENRLPFVHAMNNGPSVVMLPSGRYQTITPAHQAGAFITQVPYSNDKGGTTFFNQHPNWFLGTCQLVLTLLLMLACWRTSAIQSRWQKIRSKRSLPDSDHS